MKLFQKRIFLCETLLTIGILECYNVDEKIFIVEWLEDANFKHGENIEAKVSKIPLTKTTPTEAPPKNLYNKGLENKKKLVKMI